jgi:hypothetical protein
VDGRRFDVISKRLATGASRRSALKALLAGAGGGAFTLLTARSSEAAGCKREWYLWCCQGQAGTPCGSSASVCETNEGRACCRSYAQGVFKTPGNCPFPF